MMGLFTLISFVLVVKFVGAIKEMDAKFGFRATMWESGYSSEILWVNAEHNNITYDLLDKLEDVNLVYDRDDGYSKFYLKNINFDHAGKWRIMSLIRKNHVQIMSQDLVDLRVIKDEELLPTNCLVGEEGTYVKIHFKNYFDNITNCTLTSSDNSKIYKLSDSKNEKVKGLEIYEKCGVRMLLNSSLPSKWQLSQENEKKCVMSATFTIHSEPKFIAPENRSEIWKIGSHQTIIELNSDIQFCEIEQPNGRVIPLHSYKCTYTVKQVNNNHAGIWRVRYVPTYSMNVVHQNINVSVVDPRKVDWSMTKDKNGLTNMQCQTFLEEIDYCLFTSPQGEIINAISAFGNEKYEYYGTTHRTIQGKNYSQCGLTIRNPSDDDKGSWMCTIQSTDSSMNPISTYLATNGNKEKDVGHLRITTHEIFVKVDDDFTLKCTTERSLEYCSLQSPNGTIYSVTKNRGNVPNHLPYTGEGLSASVCGAYIEKANKIHNGSWTCRLGVSSAGLEIESTVMVSVSDAYVVPREKIINVHYDSYPELHVSVLPNKELTIKYCRWILPTGQTFTKRNAGHYLREKNETSCSVTLKGVRQVDIGTWGCYVGFNSGSDEETYTTIEVVDNE